MCQLIMDVNYFLYVWICILLLFTSSTESVCDNGRSCSTQITCSTCLLVNCVNNGKYNTELKINGCGNLNGNDLLPLIKDHPNITSLEINNVYLEEFPMFICNNLTNLEHIIITNTSLKHIPNDCSVISKNQLNFLNLQHNLLKSFPGLDYKSQLNLTTLDVSRNRISYIDRDSWLRLTQSNIQNLYLNNNLIVEDTLLGLEDIVLPKHLNIHLYNNPFNCDCKDFWITSWLLNNQENLPHISNITCKATSTRPAVPIFKLTPNDNYFNCGVLYFKMLDTGIKLAVVLICLLVLLPLILLIVIVLLYQFRRQVFTRFSWHPFERDECLGEDMGLDVYISCAHDMQDWVQKFLIEFLKLNNYKVGWSRDHMNCNKPIYDSIGEQIEHSKRTLCVFSKRYPDNDLCMFELNYSLTLDKKHGRHRTLIIKDNTINLSNLNSEIVTDMKNIRCFDKESGNLFRKELLYYLPISRIDDGNSSGLSDHAKIDIPQDVPMQDYF